VAAATSLTDVMEEVSVIYKKARLETTLTFTFGGSGSLMTQIEEGAPADIFISASQKQMNILEEKNMLIPDTRRNILINKVVLIEPVSSEKDIKTFEDINEFLYPDFKYLKMQIFIKI